jgi:hypothetical protein
MSEGHWEMPERVGASSGRAGEIPSACPRNLPAPRRMTRGRREIPGTLRARASSAERTGAVSGGTTRVLPTNSFPFGVRQWGEKIAAS